MNVHEHFKVFEFTEMGDERGNLVVIEGRTDVPFEIKRIFYMYGTDGDWVRGQHANRKSDFVLVNVAGRSKVKIDDGFSTAVIELNKPRMGIYIPRMIWKEMYDFSRDSVMLVLSSEHYDAEEYIRDYGDYLKAVGQGMSYIKPCAGDK